MKISNLIITTLAAGAFIYSSELSFAQGAIVFDDFLTDNMGMPGDNLTGPLNPNGFLEWSVSGGSIDLVGPALIPTGDLIGRYVDLGGSTGDPGLFSYALPLSLLPNVSYTLSFSYNSVDGATNAMSVQVAGQMFNVTSSTTAFVEFSQVFTPPEAINYLGFLADPVTGSPLTFQDLGGGIGDNSGIGIDRIMITPTVVPEPSSALLSIASLALVVLKRRRA